MLPVAESLSAGHVAVLDMHLFLGPSAPTHSRDVIKGDISMWKAG